MVKLRGRILADRDGKSGIVVGRIPDVDEASMADPMRSLARTGHREPRGVPTEAAMLRARYVHGRHIAAPTS